jgi:hypothetical protein
MFEKKISKQFIYKLFKKNEAELLNVQKVSVSGVLVVLNIWNFYLWLTVFKR